MAKQVHEEERATDDDDGQQQPPEGSFAEDVGGLRPTITPRAAGPFRRSSSVLAQLGASLLDTFVGHHADDGEEEERAWEAELHPLRQAENFRGHYGLLEHSLTDEELDALDAPDESQRKSPIPPFVAAMASAFASAEGARWLRTLKTAIILALLLASLWMFASQADVELGDHGLVSIPPDQPLVYEFGTEGNDVEARVIAQKLGPGSGAAFVEFDLQVALANGTWASAERWVVPLHAEEETEAEHVFRIGRGQLAQRIVASAHASRSLAMLLRFTALHWLSRYEVAIGVAVLVLVYAAITFELMHRATAAMVGSFVALALLSVLHSRPSFLEVVSWVDYSTLGLLFGMMTMVGMLSSTGSCEYFAVRIYRLAGGEPWRLTVILCLVISFLSAFIDSVTTVLLIVPITIRLCRVANVDPLPVIVAQVMYTNLGGASTVIGDPPNVLIVNEPAIAESGQVTFAAFALHIAPGVVLAEIAVYLWFRLTLRKRLRPLPCTKRQREIKLWRMTIEQMEHTPDKASKIVRRKLQEYVRQLESMPNAGAVASLGDDHALDIAQLEKRFVITDRPLFIKTSCVLFVVVLLFSFEPLLPIELNLVWTAVVGAMVLLVLADVRDISAVLEKIEFGTLLFFAALFVLMRALEEMGVTSFFANSTADMIRQVPQGDLRLAVAISLLIWVGGTVGAFVDNIPYTQAMIPVVVRLARDPSLGLPLAPLVWALTYGSCLGGNATLIGASANVVAAGLAEQQGHPITFRAFLRIGFPVMVISLAVTNVYLLVTHVLIPWY